MGGLRLEPGPVSLQCAETPLPSSCLLNVPAFVISLPSKQGRTFRHKLAAQPRCATTQATVVDACRPNQVVGRTLMDPRVWEQLEAARPGFDGRNVPPISKLELACTVSHLDAAQRALAHLRANPCMQPGCQDVALVVEDDISMHAMRYWKGSLRNWLNQSGLPDDWFMVSLSTTVSKTQIKGRTNECKSTRSSQ